MNGLSVYLSEVIGQQVSDQGFNRSLRIRFTRRTQLYRIRKYIYIAEASGQSFKPQPTARSFLIPLFLSILKL